MISRFPFYKQIGELDCGVACLQMITDFYGKLFSHQTLSEKIKIQEEGVSLEDISDAANLFGLKTMGVKVNYKKLIEEIPTPCIAFWRQQHFVVVYHANEEYVWIADPAHRGIYVQSKEIFNEGWICDPANQAGVLLLFEPTPVFFEPNLDHSNVETLNTL